MLCGRISDTHIFIGGWKPLYFFFFFSPALPSTQTSPQTVTVNENTGCETLASTSGCQTLASTSQCQTLASPSTLDNTENIEISCKLQPILNPVWAEEFEISWDTFPKRDVLSLA